MTRLIDNLHHRRSIRLAGFDYTSENGYFITIIAHNQDYIFDEIIDHKMELNDLGRIVHDEWFKTAKSRSNVDLFDDEFVIMPNHFHGIIWINSIGCRGTA